MYVFVEIGPHWRRSADYLTWSKEANKVIESEATDPLTFFYIWHRDWLGSSLLIKLTQCFPLEFFANCAVDRKRGSIVQPRLPALPLRRRFRTTGRDCLMEWCGSIRRKSQRELDWRQSTGSFRLNEIRNATSQQQSRGRQRSWRPFSFPSYLLKLLLAHWQVGGVSN